MGSARTRQAPGRQYVSTLSPEVTARAVRRTGAGANEDCTDYLVTISAPGRASSQHVIYRDTTQFTHAYWHEDAQGKNLATESGLGFSMDDAVQALMRRYIEQGPQARGSHRAASLTQSGASSNFQSYKIKCECGHSTAGATSRGEAVSRHEKHAASASTH